MALKHKHFVRGRVDGSIERTESKRRRHGSGNLDPPRRAASEGKCETRVTPSTESSVGPTPPTETVIVVPVPKEIHRDAPLVAATIQNHICGNSNGTNVAQLSPPSKCLSTHDRDSIDDSGVDTTQILRNGAVDDVWRQRPTQQKQQERRPGTTGIGVGMRDEEDILYLLSRIVELAENGADISSIPPFLNDETS